LCRRRMGLVVDVIVAAGATHLWIARRTRIGSLL
jgi:hypothetical protein